MSRVYIDERDRARLPDHKRVHYERGNAYVRIVNRRDARRTLETVDVDEFTSPFDETPVEYTEEERSFHRLYEGVLWDEEATGIELFAGQRMPDNVRDRILEALREGALFGTFEEMAPSDRSRLRDWLLAEGRSGGWTIRDLAGQLRNIVPTLDEYEAERIARTETQSIVTRAREEWYTEDFDADDEDAMFIWQGPDDHRTTDACEWLKDQANPEHGGEAKPLDELADLVQTAQDRFFPDLSNRKWTVHPFERHTIVRWQAR